MDQKPRNPAPRRLADDKTARLAAELRDNLKKRKEQKRMRARLTQGGETRPESGAKDPQ